MKKSFEVESDCLDIIKRIKTIDKDYFVVYDLEKQKYELHNCCQGGGTYCLTFPFDELDERAYLHVLKTRVENSEKLFEEMELLNKKLKEKTIAQTLNDFKEKMYDS